MDSLRRILLLVALTVGLTASAQAKGFFLINTGDELFPVKSFPAEVTEKFEGAKSAQVGYKCSHVGVFWADIWTWDCKMVGVLADDSYADLPDEILTSLSGDPQYGMKYAVRSAWNKYGFWGILLLALALLGFGKLTGRSD